MRRPFLYLIMTQNKDITTLEDIKLLVDTFYGKVQKDDFIGPIFNEKIANRWPDHLEKMYRFWQTILFSEHTYTGSPFPPHATMPIDESHFIIWVSNWTATVDGFFVGPNAEEAKKRGALMASIFNSKIEYFKKQDL